MSHASVHRYFVACSPGLESLLVTELGDLGLQGESTPGGAVIRGPLPVLWQASCGSRLAESVRIRLKPFTATSFAALEVGLSKLPWHAYLAAKSTIEIRVSCDGSKLYHTVAVEERVRRVLQGLGRAVELDAGASDASRERDSEDNDYCENQGQAHGTALDAARERRAAPTGSVRTIFVRIHRNEVTVSVDATGERLHRRGYRTHVGQAPIRETLAAAAVRLLQHHADHPVERVWDPCCGSGTMLAEWLQMTSGMWPAFASARERTYAFERWPIHPRLEFTGWRTAARREHADEPSITLTAFGSDRDEKTLDAARHNLANASVLDRCTLLHQDFRQAHREIPQRTAVLTNLPYGVRLRGAKAERHGAFDALDSLLGTRPDLRPAVVISNARPPSSRRTWQAAARFSNGGLAVTAWTLP